jgi:SAM-dependent methyltransferase
MDQPEGRPGLRAGEIPVSVPAQHCSKLLQEKLSGPQHPTGLVIGCGNGNEVAYLAGSLAGARVVGFDVEAKFSAAALKRGGLLRADVKRLPFRPESFDFAVAIHSLEHVGNPLEAMAEIARVMRPGGWFYLGVPNRTRVLGYVGSFDATLWQKVAWNAMDYSSRLRGRFKNEMGAHAGFDRTELERLLHGNFEDVEFLTENYLRFKYGRRLPGWTLNLLLGPHLANYSAPSHYALCRRKS